MVIGAVAREATAIAIVAQATEGSVRIQLPSLFVADRSIPTAVYSTTATTSQRSAVRGSQGPCFGDLGPCFFDIYVSTRLKLKESN